MNTQSIKLGITVLALLTATSQGGEWSNISDTVTAPLKPGYAGPTAGVVVDRGSGTVFMVVNDLGLFRSTDHGASFKQCSGRDIGGRCETGWALQGDPGGNKLACFMIYGDSAMTLDGGGAWKKFTTSHLDFGSVDWGETGQRLLALRHESGGVLTTSADGGTTWKNLEKGFSGCGVVDKNTFVATKEKEPGIFRSTDAGITWSLVHPDTPASPVPVMFENAAYWPTGKSLLFSKDKGATWKALGSAVEASHGPFFKTALHFTVAGKSGFFETTDAGVTWQKVVGLPDGFTAGRVGPNFAWDFKADIFYASTMNHPTFKYERKSTP